MTKEEKELLLKDLCGRLPYKVKVAFAKEMCDLDAICTDGSVLLRGEDGFVPDIIDGLFTGVDEVKPYLRLRASMTEEERSEYKSFLVNYEFGYFDTYSSIDWLNQHHFDYRGLIEKGLAIEAPEGMYDIK